MKNIQLTCAHALVKFLIAQKTLIDGKKEPLFPGVFGIFGHGNVACLGQALQENQKELPTWRGHHEQNMALTGIAYSRAKRRKQIFVATSSVGPGSTNMITAAAVAMSNRRRFFFYQEIRLQTECQIQYYNKLNILIILGLLKMMLSNLLSDILIE